MERLGRSGWEGITGRDLVQAVSESCSPSNMEGLNQRGVPEPWGGRSGKLIPRKPPRVKLKTWWPGACHRMEHSVFRKKRLNIRDETAEKNDCSSSCRLSRERGKVQMEENGRAKRGVSCGKGFRTRPDSSAQEPATKRKPSLQRSKYEVRPLTGEKSLQ